MFDFVGSSVEPYGFIELGNADNSLAECLKKVGAHATGVGIRWILGSPIFVPIDLSFSLSATDATMMQFKVSSTF